MIDHLYMLEDKLAAQHYLLVVINVMQLMMLTVEVVVVVAV